MNNENMGLYVEKVALHSQTHSLEKQERIVSSFLEHKLAGTDVSVYPSVTGLYNLLDPVV